MRKRNLINIFIASIFVMLITSCGGGINSDAKKAAELACKAQKMAMEMDMNNMEELQELQQEATALYKKMEGKYNSEADTRKFMEAYQEELEKCE